jgi:hypothetical protein
MASTLQTFGHENSIENKQHVAGMSLSSDDLHKCHDCIASKIVCRSIPKSISPQECHLLDLLKEDTLRKEFN